jgi:HD-GYP domain-containing protein (c-di-GMP phosphodiesterase class II)
MLDKVKASLFIFMNAIQAGKLYVEGHPKTQEFIKRLYLILSEILSTRKEFIIGIVDGELAWGEEIFFDLSNKLRGLISFLEESHIQRVAFQQGLNEDELASFIGFLTRTKRQERIDENEYFSLHGIQNIRAGRLKSQVPADSAQEQKAETVRHYESSLQTVARSVNLVLEEEEIDYLDLRFNILTVMESFMGRHQELLNLVSIKKRDLITFIHLLNVSLLSMFTASKLGFDKDDVLDIGIAALYHDIGKLSISVKLLKKKGKLAEAEFTRMKDHSLLGTKILLRYKDSLGILPAVAAFEHHLRHDLQGYPKVAYPQPPHIVSLIISMCDVYDALAQKRTYKKDYPPDKIYEVMLKERGGLFAPQLFDRFFQFIGVWPVGTIVRLSDKSVAVVREVNESDIFNPQVEVLSPKKKRGRVNLSAADQLSIKNALNPLGGGKRYLEMAWA